MKSFKKSITLLFLFMIVGIGNLWASTNTVGETDKSTVFNGAAKTFTLAKGRKLHIEFQNYGGKENYHNWVLMLKNAAGTADYLTLRADNYWWNNNDASTYSKESAVGCVYNYTTNITDWNTFRNDMDGATVEMDIIFNRYNRIDVETKATKSGNVYRETVSINLSDENFGDNKTPDVVYPRLTVDNSYLVIDNSKYVCTDLTAEKKIDVEEYDFEMYATVIGGYYLEYSGTSDGGYAVTDGWMNNRFRLGDGTDNGVHRNYWRIRNDSGYAGLFNAKSGQTTNLYITNLSQGDKVTIYCNGYTRFLSDITDASAGDNVVSGTEYTMGSSGTLDLITDQYACITKIKIAKPTTGIYWLDHESNTDTTPWIAVTYPDGRSLVTDDATYGKYFQYYTANQSGNRECYNQAVTSGDFSQYVFEFDAAFNSGNQNGSQLAVLTTTHTGNSNYTGSNYLFKLESSNSDRTTYTINGTSNTVTLTDGTWYHFKLIVDGEARTVYYSVNGATGTYTYTGSEDMDLKEIYYNAGRGYNTAKFDNLNVWAVSEPFIRFSSNAETVDITEINFNEPTISKYPSDATVTYTSSDESIAKVGSDGNVMMIDPGRVVITATITQGGTDYSASYTLDITAEDGDFYYEGHKATAYYTGKFNSRVANGVPGITMETGNVTTGNTSAAAVTVIREVNNTKIVTTLGSDGWHDVQFNTSKEPTEGSYYVFKPTASGKLTIKGFMTANNTVYMVASDAVTTNLITSPTFTSNSTLVSISNVNVEAGKTYYLFGRNPRYDNNSSENWCVFQLSTFEFVPDYRFEYTSLVYRNNKLYDEEGNEVTPTNNAYFPQTVMNPTGTVTYSCKKMGEVKGDFNTSTGAISNYSGDTGGAYVVTAHDASLNMTVFYTLTIPYDEYTWEIKDPAFANTSANESDLIYNKNWGASWGLNTQIKSSNQYNQITNIQDPMLCNKVAIAGDNAAYFSQTAGLLLRSSAKQAGYTVGIKSANSFETRAAAKKTELDVDELTAAQISDIYNDMLKNYDEDEVENPAVFCIGDQTKITIPWATAGQYVKIYLYRCHTKGNVYQATNLLDLDGKEVTKDFYVTGWAATPGSNYQNPKGAYIFKVKADGPVALTLNSIGGWTQIAKIVLTNTFSSDMKLVEDVTKTKIQSTGGVYSDKGNLVFDSLNPASVTFNGAASYTLTHNGSTARFSIAAAEGSFPEGSYTLNEYTWVSGGGVTYYNGTVTVNSACTGNLKVREKTTTGTVDGTDRYVLDQQDTWIAVGSITPQTYPKTWDFTQYNMSTTKAAASYASMAATNGTRYGAWDASGSDATTLVDFAASPQVGTFTYVPTCVVGTVSIDGTNTSALEFPSGFKTDANHVKVSCEGGFKAGDVITYSGVIRNSDVSGGKYGKINIYNASGTSLYEPDTYFNNVYPGEVDPSEFTYTLTDDYNELYLGRYGNTKTWITSFKVVRPSATATIFGLKGYTNNDGQKPLFASGSELTSGSSSVAETVGLGVSVAGVGSNYIDNVVVDGTGISGINGLTIPALGSGAYVYVKASAEPTITVQGYTGETNENITTYSPSSASYEVLTNANTGVYGYRITSGENVKMSLSFSSDATISEIGVTDVTKSLNVLGYATESRSVAIDHSYTGEFTTDDANAYAIQYSSYDYTKATVSKSAEVKVVPANTGVVLYKANASTSCTVPLFYPAINNATQSESDAAALTGNLMAPCVSGKLFTSETEGENTVFIMSRTFYTYYKGIGNSEQKTSNVEAFYRMKLGSTDASNTMGANKAYLLIPTSSLPTAVWNSGNQGAKGYIYFAETLELQDETTDIKNIETIVVTEDNAPQEVYYTISGLRIDGKPSKPGLYIVNGVKRYIK